MCTEEQKRQETALLESIDTGIKHLVSQLGDLDQTVLLSSTQPWLLDYKHRRYVYGYSSVALTLTVEDIGTVSVAANSWTNLGFQENMRIYASGQAGTVAIFVRCTNNSISTGGGAVTIANVNPNGQTIMSNSSPTTLASDQTGIGTAAKPNVVDATIQNAIRNGQGFYASTDRYTSSATNNAIGIYNPNASGKTIIVFSAYAIDATSNGTPIRMRIVNANPAFGNTMSPAAFNLGNLNGTSSTTSIATVTYNTSGSAAPALSAASLAYHHMLSLNNGGPDLFVNGQILVLPATTGLAIYLNNSNADIVSFTLRWVEI
jgi:hypothetical protein